MVASRSLAALVLCLFCAVSAAAQNSSVDVLHYRIDITIPPTGSEIAATTELTVKPLATPLESLVLDFAGLTIDEVRVDDVPAPFTREGATLTIRANKSEPFRARISYHGKPDDGLFLQANKHGDRGVFADNWPNRAHHWFPSVDHPSDKASVEMFVTAPSAYDVIANGMRVDTASAGKGMSRTHWSEPVPIPVHCMVIGATDFSIVRVGESKGVEVLYYLYPRDRAHGLAELGRTPAMLELYSTLIGAYPYEKLALVESSTRFGGMENASAIFLDEKRFDGAGTMEGLAAHEIAHQWFGDSVSQTRWVDLWLSEGFAQYFGHLFFERADGRAAFDQLMARDREVYLKAYASGEQPVHDPSIKDLFALLNRNNYEKGGWVLHMLRGVMGDRAFFAGIRDYYAGYRDKNASTDDFRLVMERHAGQPLDWFFRQWIFEAGHPIYALGWTWGGGKVAVDVEQKQSGTVYRMPVVIEVKGAGTPARETVVINERREHFEIDSETEPTEVVLDPDNMVLKEVVPLK